MNKMAEKEFLKFLINEDIYSVDKTNAVEAYQEIEIKTPEVAEPKENLVEPEPNVVHYKPILVIVEDTTSEGLNNQDKQYLAKILSAVKADLHSITLINIQKEALKELNGVENILMFTPNSTLPIKSELYELANFDSAKIIASDPLGKVAQSVELRKQLWAALQKMFG